jgi:8-oxo-dGTP pyrophosphatase MutT (NUDIX family)
MLTEIKPLNFNPGFNVSGCFCEVKGEFLLLKRREEKSHADKWALPGGKEDEGETSKDAMLRENLEETGIDISDRVNFFKTVYEKYPEGDFVYNIFHAVLDTKPQVKLSVEHSDFVWVTPHKALQMDLIEDLNICINMLYPQINPAIVE